jgi:allantoin racemase
MRILYQKVTEGVTGPYVEHLNENLNRAKRPDTIVDIKGIRKGIRGLRDVAYRTLRFYNDREIFESILEAKEEYDGIIIGCFYDPTVEIIREISEIPIVGPAHISLSIASMMGSKIGLVTFNDKSIPDIEHMISLYGFDKKCLSSRPVRSLTMSIDDQLNALYIPDKLTEEFYKVASSLIEDGAEVIIPACLVISPILVRSNMLAINKVPIVDVISVSLAHCEMMSQLHMKGLPVLSRKGFYEGPEGQIFEQLKAYF